MQPRAWDLVRRRFALWTLTLSCVLGLAAYALSGRPLALSFLAGALIGALNLSILAGSADRLLRAVQDAPNVPAGTGGRAARAWALMRCGSRWHAGPLSPSAHCPATCSLVVARRHIATATISIRTAKAVSRTA